MIPFKLTKKKLKQLLPPPELVLQAGLLPGAPRYLAKLFPGLGRLFSSFLQTPLWVLSCSPEEKPYKGFICFLFQLGCGSTPLHFSWQSPPSHIPAISRGFAAWERRIILSGKHTPASSDRERIPDGLWWCAAMQGTSSGASHYQHWLSLITSWFVVFFLLFPMLDLLQ